MMKTFDCNAVNENKQKEEKLLKAKEGIPDH